MVNSCGLTTDQLLTAKGMNLPLHGKSFFHVMGVKNAISLLPHHWECQGFMLTKQDLP